MVDGFYLSPDPSPAWVIAESLSYCWLERGVEERGGSAPSQYFPPFQSNYLRGSFIDADWRGGLRG